jgi:RimJ/RimL family protein N-acetyltransferase
MNKMQFHIETKRLILRDFLETDQADLFEMDSDPEVHRYLGNNPVKTIDEIASIIKMVRQQYIDNQIGRWMMVEKATGNVLGWAGLKYIHQTMNSTSHFYDVGYRLKQKHWGKGYASEAAQAALAYGFNQLNLTEIIGITAIENQASANILKKIGLQFVNQFNEDGMKCNWFKITSTEWRQMKDSR